MVDEDRSGAMCEFDGASFAADYEQFVDVEWSDEDEPQWDEGDGEAELDGPVVDFLSFGAAIEIDDSSYARWLQSCLRGLVAPDLVVDGVPGGKTRQAIRAFQRQIGRLRPGARALTVDGVDGPATIAALELCTNSTHPPRTTETPAMAVVAPEPTAKATQHGVFTLTTAEGTHHTVEAYGDRVAFRYKTRDRTGVDGKSLCDGFNVMAYEGARRDLLADELLLRRGFSASEIAILRENAYKESRGSFGAVNTWDDQIVSWGMAQFAGHAGSLAGLLIFLKETAPEAFARFFSAAGIDVAYGPYPYFDRKARREITRTGAYVKITADGVTYAGDRGWAYLRTRPVLVGALMLAGNDVEIQIGQCQFWREMFLDRAVATRIGGRASHRVVRVHGTGAARSETTLLAGIDSDAAWRAWAARPENLVEGQDLARLLGAGDRCVHRTREGDRVVATVEKVPGQPLRSFCSSTYGLGVMARLYSWMPAYVRGWSEAFLKELAASHPGVDVGDPAAWDREPALETEFIEKVKARRRQVKQGSYDSPYGDSLSRRRGSFIAGTAVEVPAAPDSDEEAPDGAEEPEDETCDVVMPVAEDAVPAAATVAEDAVVTPGVARETAVVAPGVVGQADATSAPVPGDRPDFDLTAQSPGEKRKRTRAWSEIKGITLHQTGVHGFGARAWPRVTAHLGVHSDGRVYLIHPLQAYLWSSDALNRDTVAIEVAGNFIGDPARPNSFWKPGGGPSKLTPAMIDGLRRAVRWIIAEVARHGGEITDVFAHRQAKRGKSNCPGAEIWLHAGVWAQTRLGLGNGGPGFTRSDGQPIPPAWDPRLLDQPLPFADPDAYVIDFEAMTAEEGAEFPADGEDPFAARPQVVARAVRVRSLPAGMRLADARGDDATVTRGRLDLSAPIDLDAAEDAAIAGHLDEALARQGLVAVDTIMLEPDRGARVRSLDDIDLDGGSADDALEFEITIEEDERAVVLLEQDGMFSWSLPEEREDGRRTRGGADVARFRISRASADATVDGPTTRGLVSAVLGGAIRARVYKFVAGLVVTHGLPALIEHLERGVREGVVLVGGEDLRDWVDRDDLRDLRLPQERPARVLLLVHGTFSSTRGSFGGLCTGSGPDALRRMLAGYDAVFGVDHRSLSRTPQDNAAAIRDLLRAHPWPHPPEIDIVCFSRGGLVTRELVERVLPEAKWPGTIGRVICVATTNTGTELARPDNWRDLVDVYTTLACATMRGLGLAAGALAGLIGGEIVSAVGALVQALAGGLLHSGAAPGLSAMDPEGEVVRALNARTLVDGPRPRYFAITSCFDASKPGATAGLTAHARRVLAGRVIGKLYRGAASDLVVHNASTQTLHPTRSYSDHHHFEANGSVYHVNFFLQPEVVTRLIAWLELGEVRPARPPGFVIPALIRREAGEDGPLAFGPTDDALIDLYVRAEAPARVGLEELFKVDVELSREALALAASVNAALASALVEAGELVTVELVPRARVSPVAQPPVSVAVPARGGTVGLWFRVRAEEVGEGELWVIVRQHGRPLARLVLHVQVVEGTGVAAELVRAAAGPDGAPGAEPEAVLEVIELREAGGLRYRYHLRAPALGLHHRFESRLIPSGADDYVRGLFDRIEREWQSAGAQPRAFDRRLRALGVQLGEQLLPPELMALLWDRREQLLGLQLLSDEGGIPWELVHLKHPARPLAPDQSAFLGQLGLVRALWGAALPQRLSARAGKVFTVVPEYPTPALALPSALSERTWLSEHVGARAMDPRPEATLDALATPGSFDLLHFACHGEVEAHDAWLLLQGEVREVQEGGVTRRKYFPGKLGAAEVAAAADLRGEQGRRPLVFLNACKVARSEHLLTGFVGFAPVLLGLGAGAVVAPLWSVGDGTALRFAEGFYAALLQGGSFAEAAVTARAHARALGDPTWLAYAVYAAPGGRMKIDVGGAP